MRRSRADVGVYDLTDFSGSLDVKLRKRGKKARVDRHSVELL